MSSVNSYSRPIHLREPAKRRLSGLSWTSASAPSTIEKLLRYNKSVFFNSNVAFTLLLFLLLRHFLIANKIDNFIINKCLLYIKLLIMTIIIIIIILQFSIFYLSINFTHTVILRTSCFKYRINFQI